MKRYEARINVEYVTMIEAESPEKAQQAAAHIDVQDFDAEAWSPVTVEEVR